MQIKTGQGKPCPCNKKRQSEFPGRRGGPKGSFSSRSNNSALLTCLTRRTWRAWWVAVAFILSTLTGILSFPSSTHAKLYIDITNPERRIPIAISPLSGPLGGEIAQVVSEDLDYTGLFILLRPEGFTELPYQEFRSENWAPAGVLCVLKGTVTLTGTDLEAQARFYDVETGAELFAKKYKGPKTLLRMIAHSIADDIYKEVTGVRGVFRSRLSFITDKGGAKDINLADWDGQRARALGLKERMIMGPRWSREKGANALVYSAERRRRWGIYRLDLATMKEKLLFERPGTNIAGDTGPNGEVLFSSSFEGSPDIYMMYRDGSVKQLTRARAINVSPSFSPDSRRIVFVSNQGGTPQIYIMDLNGYNMSRLSYNGSYNTSPSWSPDGERVAFAGRYEGKNQIFLARVDGTETVVLTSRGNNEEPAFSPDGKLLVFTSDRDGYKAVYTMRANGEEQRRISPAGVKAFGPRWSNE
jgi:TolB protein